MAFIAFSNAVESVQPLETRDRPIGSGTAQKLVLEPTFKQQHHLNRASLLA